MRFSMTIVLTQASMTALPEYARVPIMFTAVVRENDTIEDEDRTLGTLRISSVPTSISTAAAPVRTVST
jgi:hypothetical protein